MAERGFAGWFWARNFEEAGPGEPEGVALFYRTSLFAPLAHTAAPFTQAGPQPPIPGGARRQKGDVWWHWQQRGEGMVAAALRHLPSNQTCVVASTHLYWHPNYPDIKALQAAAMAHQLADFMRSHTGGTAAPLIACGDFNSLWRKYVSDEFDTVPLGGFCVSGVYELLSTGSLAPWHADHPASRRRRGEPPCPPDLQAPLAMPAGLRLASAQMLAHGREPLLTHKTNRFAGCLDYIWITPDCLEVAETLAMPYEEPEDLSMIPLALPFGPIPNEAFGSDHLALGAVLLLKTPPAST